MPEKNEHAGRCVKIAMVKAGLTGQTLANKLGNSSRSSVVRYVQGACSKAKLEEIASACGMSYEDMIALAD